MRNTFVSTISTSTHSIVLLEKKCILSFGLQKLIFLHLNSFSSMSHSSPCVVLDRIFCGFWRVIGVQILVCHISSSSLSWYESQRDCFCVDSDAAARSSSVMCIYVCKCSTDVLENHKETHISPNLTHFCWLADWIPAHKIPTSPHPLKTKTVGDE